MLGKDYSKQRKDGFVSQTPAAVRPACRNEGRAVLRTVLTGLGCSGLTGRGEWKVVGVVPPRSGRERYLYRLGWPVSLPCWLYLCLVLHLLYTLLLSQLHNTVQYLMYESRVHKCSEWMNNRRGERRMQYLSPHCRHSTHSIHTTYPQASSTG